ncbi:MAG: acetylglutamate kinase [Verrucomicrobiota bacterium]
MDKLIEKAAILMEALPYIQEFRNSVVVVKLGGSVIEDITKTRGVIRDIVFMECAGMRPLIVHGGGKAISTRLTEEGVESHFVNGLRYTSKKAIKIIDEVLHNQINSSLKNLMEELNGHPQSLSGKDVLKAEKYEETDQRTGQTTEWGQVGRVTGVDTMAINALLEQNLVPIITPLASGTENNGIYNINADTAACKIAAALQAKKLAFLSDVPGIMKDPEDEDSLIPTIKIKEVESLIAAGTIGRGMIPKVRSAVEAVKAGTEKVHMIDGRVQHSLLLEIFTRRGIGTQIVTTNRK